MCAIKHTIEMLKSKTLRNAFKRHWLAPDCGWACVMCVASMGLIYATYSHMLPYLVCVFKPLNGCHRH